MRRFPHPPVERFEDGPRPIIAPGAVLTVVLGLMLALGGLFGVVGVCGYLLVQACRLGGCPL